jgi:DNA polymerase I
MAKKLFLIDGSNHAFRVFHAMPRDMYAAGFPTGALLGFANMLRRLEREHEPDYVVVCFDNGPSFRKDMYPEYKGHRPEKPEELDKQWPHFKELVEAWGYAYLDPTGVEADDVIGTMAEWASESLEVVMVSGDKDFYQLIGPHKRIYDVMKDKWIGHDEVVERFGVPPDRVIDILGMAGDSSDNVPGVPGVGEKTAAKYVQKYGNMENVISNAGTIGGKRGKSVSDFADQARLSRELVTIKLDCDLPLSLSDLVPRQRNIVELRKLFMKWQFRTHLKELQEAEADMASAVATDRYRVAEDAETVKKELASIRAKQFTGVRVAVEVHTDNRDPFTATVLGFGLCWGAADAVYIPVDAETGPLVAELLADARIPKTGHDLKFAHQVLAVRGFALAGQAGDVMLADYLLEPARNKHGLSDLSLRYMGHELLDEPVHRAHVAWMLDEELNKRIAETHQLGVYHDIELPLIPVLARMEIEGIGVDTDGLAALATEYRERLDTLEKRVYELAGREFKINSPKELQVILFDELGLEPLKKTKKGFSTDAATLEHLRDKHDLPDCILKWRQLDKLRSTYVEALPKSVHPVTGRIHTNFQQAVAETGRLSSANPNLQNIPNRSEEGRRIRECFVARPGRVFVSCDYSQVELRLLAHFCGDGPLKAAFESGRDIHRATAADIFDIEEDAVDREKRTAAKAINFGIIYGMAAPRLARDLKISRDQAKTYIERYFAGFPQVKQFIDGRVEDARHNGHTSTIHGRRRTVSHLNSRNFMDRSASERIAVNTPIQGSAADVIKLAMVRVARRLERDFPDARLLLQVHDELLLEVAETQADAVAAAVQEEMEGITPLSVHLKVESGRANTWAGAH